MLKMEIASRGNVLTFSPNSPLRILAEGLIGFDGGAAAEVVLAVALLAVVEVCVAALRTHDLPVLRELHALDGALLRFHLRHFLFPFVVSLPVGQPVFARARRCVTVYSLKFEV